jgi:transposase
MEVVHRQCAGLDVHKEEVVACTRVQHASRVTYTEARFPTTTRGLLALAEWLQAQQCLTVAMEATGVYWKPVWHLLEECCDLILVNPQHVRAVPGRKSDTNDAHWLADLLAHGLVRASFVPPTPIQELRDLTRTRSWCERSRSTRRGSRRPWRTPTSRSPGS